MSRVRTGRRHMGWTERKRDRLLRTMFEKDFLVTKKALSELGMGLLDSGPDESITTYYQQRERRRLEASDFELDPGDLDSMEGRLRELWDRPEASALSDLAATVLAASPRFEGVETDEEVPDLIYAMF